MKQFHIRKYKHSVEIYVEDDNGHHATIEMSKEDFYKEIDVQCELIERFRKEIYAESP